MLRDVLIHEKQTYNNIEIIFYDDGSKDNSYEIAKRIKGIKSFKNRNRKNLGKFNTYYQLNSYKKAFSRSKVNIYYC